MNHGISFPIVVLVFVLSGCERFELDRRMEELCKADGGVRVYETITLPPEMFDQYGDPFPGWRGRPESLRLGGEFELKHESEYLKRGDPLKGQGQLVRSHWKVIRSLDNKVLGEAVVYGRSGGDFVVIDHFTSKTCPQQVGAPGAAIRAVFIKEKN